MRADVDRPTAVANTRTVDEEATARLAHLEKKNAENQARSRDRRAKAKANAKATISRRNTAMLGFDESMLRLNEAMYLSHDSSCPAYEQHRDALTTAGITLADLALISADGLLANALLREAGVERAGDRLQIIATVRRRE